jgi:hypothetical protein
VAGQENSRPIAAPVWARSLDEPSRSSRAISDACRLAGTARAEGGTEEAAIRPPASLPASRMAFSLKLVTPKPAHVLTLMTFVFVI